jgi:hypothetical protein
MGVVSGVRDVAPAFERATRHKVSETRDSRMAVSRNPEISADLCAGFLVATHQFQLCS